MKIAIVCPTSHNKPYDGDTLKREGIGASWSGVIYLARELHGLGHEVFVLNHCNNPGKYEGVTYLTEKIPQDIQEKRHVQRTLKGIDALIVNRAGNADWHDCVERWCDYTGYRKYLLCCDAGGAHKGQPEKFSRYDKVVAISDWLNQINIEANHSISPDYFMAIPMGVDTEMFKPDEARRTDICFLGAVVDARRPQLAIEAFALAKKMRPDIPLKLHMIGSAAIWGGPAQGGSDQASVNFRQMIHNTLLKNNLIASNDIICYGDISSEEVARILPKMGMMVYPTYLETCGVSILEAQAAGVPVIVPQDSMNSAVRERIYHTETGIVRDFARMDEVALAIIDMVENDHVYNKVRKQAREKVVRFNDWKTIARRWDNEVLRGKSALQLVERKQKLRNETIGVGVLSFQNRPLLEKCINSLKQHAEMPLKIVVWDNNSKGYNCDNVAWLRANHPDITIMEAPENRHCTISRNSVIEYFRTQYPDMKYMLFSDMDVIFKKGFLFPMVEIMESHDDAAIVAYEEANCGFRPDDDGRVSEVMSICNLHRLSSFNIFPNPNRPFDEKFKVYSFDSWVCQTFNINGWKTYLVRGRKGYDHVGGQINGLLTDAEKIKTADVKYWQSIADKMSLKKPWEDKNSADYINIGNNLKDNGMCDEAMREYLEGISRCPDDSTLHFCLANLYKEQKNWKMAIESYKNALIKNPRNFEAIYGLEASRRGLAGIEEKPPEPDTNTEKSELTEEEKMQIRFERANRRE